MFAVLAVAQVTVTGERQGHHAQGDQGSPDQGSIRNTWGICVSNEAPGDAEAAGQGPLPHLMGE